MQSGIRRVYFYDLELGVNKEKATPPPMDDVLRAIKARVDARQAVHPINKRTAHLEIGDMTVDSVNNCAILLLKYLTQPCLIHISQIPTLELLELREKRMEKVAGLAHIC